MEKVIETPRLILRPLEKRDAAFILALLTDPSFIQNIGDRGVHDLAQAEGYIAKTQDGYLKNGYGMALVEKKDTGEAIGISGLVRRETLPEPDIGFAFLPQFWRMGYALESGFAVMDFAKNQLALPGLLAITSPGNQGSQRVLEKMGFSFQKKLRLTPSADEVNLYSIRWPR
jgi:RimJ/RimL family protein N-acetyltransferase